MVEAPPPAASAAIQAILRAGRSAGLALRLDTPVARPEPYLDRIDALLLLGTAPGVKGQDLAPDACDRLVADAGIRAHTVPLLGRPGADVIVHGSYFSRGTC